MAVYAVAFVVMLAAGAMLALSLRDFLGERSMLWASIGLSAAAVVLAVASVLLPRRS
jgi:hypothetical protein